MTTADADHPAADTDRADGMRQIRYAVVLNGGVSLAIWMGGVTNELNRLRLASELLHGGGRGVQASPAWQAILEASNRSVAVDVLAGTSAGGLNGTLLATAVARGADMPPMGEQWEKVASLSKGALTRDDTERATSLLDGSYFSRKLTEILGMIAPKPGVTINPRECTLLVTATALDSDPVPTRMEAGGCMFTRDGRRVYKFQRTEGPSDDESGVRPIIADNFATDPWSADILRLAARASASFPAAFSPVQETPDLAGLRVDKQPDEPRRWLVDGGVLDNAPFEPLLDVLRERPISEPFERVLLYITPGVSGDDNVTPPPAPLKLIPGLGSVVSAMREPDARLDAKALQNLFQQMSFSKAQSFRTIADYLENPQKPQPGGLFRAAADLFEHYRVTRSEATERQLHADSTGDPDSVVLAPPRPTKLKPEEIPGIPPKDFPAFDGTSWKWGWTTADRILRWWGRAVSGLKPVTSETRKALAVIGNAQRKIFACESTLNNAVLGVSRIDQQLRAMAEVYNGQPDGLATVLAEAIIQTANAIAEAVPGVDARMLIEMSLAVEVISSIYSWSADGYDTPVLRFHNITPAAETPPGLDLRLEKKQKHDWPSKKLYGERLGHFGAFISPEGRRHDWLWGRLDGASELSKQILAAAGKSEDVALPLREALIDEILEAEGKSQTKIAADVTKVYKASNRAMIRKMISSDGGELTFRQLESTVWALSRQWGAAGGWLRALLAPHWSMTEEWSTTNETGIRWWCLPAMNALRLATGWLRVLVPLLLAYERHVAPHVRRLRRGLRKAFRTREFGSGAGARSIG